MNSLRTTYKTISYNGKKYITAEDIHKAVNSHTYYTRWFKRLCKTYKLVKDIDFINFVVDKKIRQAIVVDKAISIINDKKGLKSFKSAIKPKGIETEIQESMFNIKNTSIIKNIDDKLDLTQEGYELLSNNKLSFYMNKKNFNIVVNSRDLYKLIGENVLEYNEWIKYFIKNYYLGLQDYKIIKSDYIISIRAVMSISAIYNSHIRKNILDIISSVNNKSTNNLLFRRINNISNDLEYIKRILDLSINNKSTERYKGFYKYNAITVAKKIGLYSVYKKPHANFINALATKLGFFENTVRFQMNDFVFKEKQLGSASTIYYTEKAFNILCDHILNNKDNIFQIVYEGDKQTLESNILNNGKTFHFDIECSRKLFNILVTLNLKSY